MSTRGWAGLAVLALAIAAAAAWMLDATGAPGTLLVATGAAVALAAGLLVRALVPARGGPRSASAPARREDALASAAEQLVSELAFAADRRRAYDSSIRPTLQRMAALRWSRAHPGSAEPGATEMLAWLGPAAWDLLDPDRPPAGPAERGVRARTIRRLLTVLTQPPAPPAPSGRAVAPRAVAPRAVAPARAGRGFRRAR